MLERCNRICPELRHLGTHLRGVEVLCLFAGTINLGQSRCRREVVHTGRLVLQIERNGGIKLRQEAMAQPADVRCLQRETALKLASDGEIESVGIRSFESRVNAMPDKEVSRWKGLRENCRRRGDKTWYCS